MLLERSDNVVKGLSKRVVVVKSPTKIFEEAIFILKEAPLVQYGVDANQIVKEACSIAEHYDGKLRRRKASKNISSISFIALGAAITGLLWIASVIL